VIQNLASRLVAADALNQVDCIGVIERADIPDFISSFVWQEGRGGTMTGTNFTR
jgi:hypothetical protein